MAELKTKKDMAVLPKPKLIVYIGRSQKVFKLTSTTKIAPKDPKNAKRDPNVAELKTNR